MNVNPKINNCGWEFRCPQWWEKLTPTVNQSVRHCSECNQFVFLCETEDELEYHARRRHCVALPPSNKEEKWMLMGRYVLPPYNGATMTLTLEPTYSLDQEQLQFLARTFNFSPTDYQLRVKLCDGQLHVLGQGLHPDVAEELSQRMNNHVITHNLTVDPS